MGALETGKQRIARIVREDRMLSRERAVRERLIAFFRRAAVEESMLTGTSSWTLAADALMGAPMPPVNTERHAWFSAQLRASFGSVPADHLTARRAAQLVDDLAVGLSLVGSFEQLGDLAERLGELVADALQTPAGKRR